MYADGNLAGSIPAVTNLSKGVYWGSRADIITVRMDNGVDECCFGFR